MNASIILNSMMDKMLALIETMGTFSYLYVAVAMALEGASIPFPGMYVLILCGFIIKKCNLNIITVTFIGSVAYTTAALIPYYIGKGVNNYAKKKFSKYLKKNFYYMNKVSYLFNKYGEISICLSRPTFMGNYFSYIAGINKMKLWKFIIYTFIGIYPWVAVMSFIGYKMVESIDQIRFIIDKLGPVFFIGSIVLILALIVFIFMKKAYEY